MIKGLFWTAVGAAGALQVDKWMSRTKARFSPGVVTGSFLDKINGRLEAKRGSSGRGSGTSF